MAVYSFISYERFRYKDYVYPWWAEMIGWLMAFSSMAVVPIYAIYKICTTSGTLRDVISPLTLNIFIKLYFH